MSGERRAVLCAVLVWAIAVAVGPSCYAAQQATASGPPDLSALARQAGPAVGVVVTLDANGNPLSQGTAFFVRADGVAITCHHVLSGAASALLRMENGAFFPVEGMLATDQARDLALLKVTGKDLPIVSLGDSSALAPGQRLVAITAPQGLGNTVADGLVSAVRELPSGPLVQVTIPLSPGSSGGPIFDLSGKVVAVAAAVLTEGQALNFAIPINVAKQLLVRPGRPIPLTPVERSEDLGNGLQEGGSSPPRASTLDLLVEALEARNGGRYQEAVEHLQVLVELDPALYPGRCCLGSAYADLGRWQDAVDCYEQAIRLKPVGASLASAEYKLGVAHSSLGHWREAADASKEAICLKPDYAEAHRELGHAYNKLGLYGDAEAACKEAIRLKPDYTEAYVELGVACGNLGRHEDTEVAFSKAVLLKPDCAEAYRGMGVLYDRLGRYEEAIDSHREAIRLRPDYAEAHHNLGWSYCNAGRYSEAIASYQQAIRLEPKDPGPPYNLGIAYSKLGRWDEASAAFMQAIRLKPECVEAHCMRGRAYSVLGRYEDAVGPYTHAVWLDPDSAEALCGLGYTYNSLGRWEEAAASLKQTTDLRPDLANAHYGLGCSYYGLSRYQEALEAFKGATGLEPDWTEAHYSLGVTHLRLDDRTAALDEYRILQKLDSDQAAKLLALIYP
ncbi:MAG: tetratricopeptide repeat protein [Armatimonadota bacterium]